MLSGILSLTLEGRSKVRVINAYMGRRGVLTIVSIASKAHRCLTSSPKNMVQGSAGALVHKCN